MTHICVGKLTNIGSDNGLSPGRRQAIIWTNTGILLIGPLGTNFNEILIKIQTFSFTKIHLKISSAKWRPFFAATMCWNVARERSILYRWLVRLFFPLSARSVHLQATYIGKFQCSDVFECFIGSLSDVACDYNVYYVRVVFIVSVFSVLQADAVLKIIWLLIDWWTIRIKEFHY